MSLTKVTSFFAFFLRSHMREPLDKTQRKPASKMLLIKGYETRKSFETSNKIITFKYKQIRNGEHFLWFMTKDTRFRD